MQVKKGTRLGVGRAQGLHWPKAGPFTQDKLTILPAFCRDLGTSLSHLQVLWLARCGLTDLDGIGSFPVLKVGLCLLGWGWSQVRPS